MQQCGLDLGMRGKMNEISRKHTNSENTKPNIGKHMYHFSAVFSGYVPDARQCWTRNGRHYRFSTLDTFFLFSSFTVQPKKGFVGTSDGWHDTRGERDRTLTVSSVVASLMLLVSFLFLSSNFFSSMLAKREKLCLRPDVAERTFA
jgi:hypothetical protein